MDIIHVKITKCQVPQYLGQCKTEGTGARFQAKGRSVGQVNSKWGDYSQILTGPFSQSYGQKGILNVNDTKEFKLRGIIKKVFAC